MHPSTLAKQQSLTDALPEAVDRHVAGASCWRLFDRRVRGHMEAVPPHRGQHLSGKAAIAGFSARLNSPLSSRRVIYVHIPFCSKVCTFCAFAKQSGHAHRAEGYAQIMLRQISRLSRSAWARQGPPFEAVYFGGGTPTILPVEVLAGLVGAIRSNFILSENCEITVECRFDGVDEAMLSALRQSGVNRVSFGVQSFDTDVRRGVGRIVSQQQVLETLARASEIGFESINVDLIYNLPGQTLNSWRRDLEVLAESPVTATSVYALIPASGSPLLSAIKAGRHPPLAGVEAEYAYFRHAFEWLTHRLGWERFSMHHFGKVGHERSVYNSVRAKGYDTLAFGCGSGGHIAGLSYMNSLDYETYERGQLAESDLGLMAGIGPEGLGRLNEVYALTEGRGLQRERLLELLPEFGSRLEMLRDMGLIECRDSVLTLTADGCFWGYNITALLTEAIDMQLASPACAGGRA